jgi:dGTPase
VTGPEPPIPPGYGPADVERLVPEPGKRPQRTAFERDRARVVHSAALRRLSAKTQVVGPGTDDFVRNRLTHSLEVAQVGRELGKALGCDPDLVDTACLAHDLGHPPFGHNGEAALAEVAAGCGGFEGNAQTLRLLTRLEAKTVDGAGRSAGLNLTRASLDAATKYPWLRGAGPGGTTKFGGYDDDRPVFDWLRAGAEPGRPCVEAQVMDLADDVAYSVHDVEDAVVAGRLHPGRLTEPDVRARVADLVRAWYLPDASPAEIDAALDRVQALPSWVPEWDGSRGCLAALKNLTSDLIGRFCAAVQLATHERAGPGRLTRHGADLVVPRETLTEIVALKGVAAVFVMTADDRQPLYARQREVAHELVDMLRRAPDALEPTFRRDWADAADDAARLRVVVDQVASLTDASATALHGRLTGR